MNQDSLGVTALIDSDEIDLLISGDGGSFGPCPPKANHRGPTYLHIFPPPKKNEAGPPGPAWAPG